LLNWPPELDVHTGSPIPEVLDAQVGGAT